MINQNTYSVLTNNPACMEEFVATKPPISELVNKIKDVCQENCGCANNIHDTLFGSNPSDPLLEFWRLCSTMTIASLQHFVSGRITI